MEIIVICMGLTTALDRSIHFFLTHFCFCCSHTMPSLNNCCINNWQISFKYDLISTVGRDSNYIVASDKNITKVIGLAMFF